MAHVAPSGATYQAGTLAGHPLSMAAGEATLSALEPARYAALEAASERLEVGLRQAAAAAGRPASVARIGSLLTLFFCASPPIDASDARAIDRAAFARFFGAMLDLGILLPPSPFEAWFVSLAHGPVEIDATLDAARQAFLA
jgi:glutamate-1-semialdehyde 2,1-aminomutase